MKGKYLFKTIAVGTGGVGKTSLIRRFAEGFFLGTYVPTLGVDFATKEVQLGDQTIKLVLFDTGGQELLGRLRPYYYRGGEWCPCVLRYRREGHLRGTRGLASRGLPPCGSNSAPARRDEGGSGRPPRGAPRPGRGLRAGKAPALYRNLGQDWLGSGTDVPIPSPHDARGGKIAVREQEDYEEKFDGRPNGADIQAYVRGQPLAKEIGDLFEDIAV